jgi:hypothetical protein
LVDESTVQPNNPARRGVPPASLSPPLQWLFAWQQIKQTPTVRQVKWPCLNHTQTPFNPHACRLARNDGAERDKPWNPRERNAHSPANFFASQRHRMTEMTRRKISKIAVFADSET